MDDVRRGIRVVIVIDVVGCHVVGISHGQVLEKRERKDEVKDI